MALGMKKKWKLDPHCGSGAESRKQCLMDVVFKIHVGILTQELDRNVT